MWISRLLPWDMKVEAPEETAAVTSMGQDRAVPRPCFKPFNKRKQVDIVPALEIQLWAKEIDFPFMEPMI